MAERREAPTPRRLREARSQGLVPRSAIAGAAAALVALAIGLVALAAGAIEEILALSRGALSGAGGAQEPGAALDALGAGARVWAAGVLPLALGVWAAVAAVTALLAGPGWTPGRLTPSLARFGPRLPGGQLSRRAADAGLGGLVGLALAAIGAGAIWDLLSRAARGSLMSRAGGLEAAAQVGADALWQLLAVLIVAAVGDVVLQKARWREDVGMSRAEIERERRAQRGAPEQRRRRKALAGRGEERA